jgi:hypothetical protein
VFLSTAKAKPVSTIDDVRRHIIDSRRDDSVVRLHDGEGFPKVTVAWRWFGFGTAAAHMMVGGKIVQVRLMLSGIDLAGQEGARLWLCRAGAEFCCRVSKPALICFEREQLGEYDGGAYLLGLILFAAFCEVCGIDDPL